MFESGDIMFLSNDEGDTSLVIDLEGDAGPTIKRMQTRHIREGMFLLARTGYCGTYADYVAEVADGLLGERSLRLRKLQRTWKTRLKRAVRASDPTSIAVKLIDLGSVRANESNIRNWISVRHIKPHKYEDFRAILTLVELEEPAPRFWKAMRQIDCAHKRAGQLIRRRLLRQVRGEALSDLQKLGQKEFSIEEGSRATITALRVASIAPTTVRVPPRRIARLLSGEVVAWRG
jgi:hypothetical protein